MNDKIHENSSDAIWKDDILNRREYSKFLGNYIKSLIERKIEPLTVALDASWGAGKTFFVQRWTNDINQANGGAIIFDAWKNDFSNDVLISFMAELSTGLQPFRERMPLKITVAEKMKVQWSDINRGFRKAILPVGAVIAKGVIQKVIGSAVDDITDAYTSGKSPEINLTSIQDAMSDVDIEKGLETFFEKTLEAHKARSIATDDFKKSLEKLVATLQEENILNGPLYIFIDELDRCRPDYAIKLLEGIKHLFSVKGVVFIICTNMDQLSKSIQAVYGAEFDGHSYLKRFFDFEFTLPKPNNYNFSKNSIDEHPILHKRGFDSGLDNNAYEKDANLLIKSFEIMCVAFGMQLRTQKQVWMIVLAASSGIPENARVYTMWLIFLAILKHSYPKEFEKMGGEMMTASEFKDICRPIGKIITTNVLRQEKKEEYDRTTMRLQEVPLIDVLLVYYQATFKNLNEIAKVFHNRMAAYPDTLLYEIAQERTQDSTAEQIFMPSLSKYHDLVRLAGLIS